MRIKITLVILAFSIGLLNGANISEELAKQVASNFVFGESSPIKEVEVYGKDKGEIYIINFLPEGWALVASNSNARPVIGYSEKGYFDKTKLEVNLKDWLDLQSMQIINADNNLKWSAEWKMLEKGALSIDKSTAAIAPLLKVEWDQGKGWNRFCPDYASGPDGKAYVGCVAVAMGQAMHHIKFPARPQGEKSYPLSPYGTISTNFDDEPAYEWEKMSLKSADDYNARLMYNCGVAVEMDYGGSGSGAYTTRVPFALQRYFGFTPGVKCIDRYSDESKWTKLLKSELESGNVLVYSGNPGTGAAGHAFNLDGVAASGYFHFNWGWSGSHNGYFSINDVAPGSSDFTAGQRVVIGIAKPYWGPTDIALSNQTVVENLPAGTVVGEISVTDYSENDEFTFEVFGAPYFDGSGYTPAKFEVKNNKLVTLEPLTSGAYPEKATIKVTDKDDLSYIEGFEITVQKTNGLDMLYTNQLKVYPSPAKSELYLETDYKYKSYTVLNLSGKILLIGDNADDRIDVSGLNRGIYFIQLTGENGSNIRRKFLKE